jgi:hypothetical protein
MDERRLLNPPSYFFQDHKLVWDANESSIERLFHITDYMCRADSTSIEIPCRLLLERTSLSDNTTQTRITLGEVLKPTICLPLASIISRDRSENRREYLTRIRSTIKVDSNGEATIERARSGEIDSKETVGSVG